MIHRTAIVVEGAEVDSTCEIGPYAIIDGQVRVGPNCRLGPHVHLTGLTQIGANNTFHTGCVIGDAPQDLKYKDEPTGLRIGDDNVFREHVTIHRSAKLFEETVIGSNNFLMAGSHIGHNSILGNHIILANGALIAGHVTVQDRVFISGNCLIHQFVRVGTLALMQGGSAISKDLPPFTIARGDNRICGLNIIGLRRAGVSAGERLELKKLYRSIFRSNTAIRTAVDHAFGEFSGERAKAMLEFIRASKRGVCADVSSGEGDEDEED